MRGTGSNRRSRGGQRGRGAHSAKAMGRGSTTSSITRRTGGSGDGDESDEDKKKKKDAKKKLPDDARKQKIL